MTSSSNPANGGAKTDALTAPSVQTPDNRLFLFTAVGHNFAIPIVEVDRLLIEGHLSPLPCAHPSLAGMAKDNADLIPVYDLAGLLGQEVVTTSVGTNVAVFATARGPLGVRMEALRGTTTAATPLADAKEVMDRTAALPPAGQTIVTAVGEVATDRGVEVFFFFSPEAFLVQLDLAFHAASERDQMAP